MKKLFCLILCLGVILGLTACKSKNNNEPKPTVDLKYYASLGQIPEAKYTLGTDINTIIDEQKALVKQEEAEHGEDPNDTHGHEEEMLRFEIIEGENNVLLDNGSVNYFYNKNKENKGISYMVIYDEAFGFPLGTVISEVKKAACDIKFIEEDANEENAFFANYVINGTVLKADFNGTVVLFLFQENELFATAMYNENWS